MKFGAVLAAISLMAAPALGQAQTTGGPTELRSKIAVKNFDRAIDFYTRYIGMEVSPLRNAHELVLEFPGGKDHPVVLYLDTCGEPQSAADSQILGPEACKNGFHAGSSWLMIVHTQIPRVIATLKAAGYPFTTMPAIGEIRYLFIKDPDGNTVELAGR